jgi:hypothetical protein
MRRARSGSNHRPGMSHAPLGVRKVSLRGFLRYRLLGGAEGQALRMLLSRRGSGESRNSVTNLVLACQPIYGMLR